RDRGRLRLRRGPVHARGLALRALEFVAHADLCLAGALQRRRAEGGVRRDDGPARAARLRRPRARVRAARHRSRRGDRAFVRDRPRSCAARRPAMIAVTLIAALLAAEPPAPHVGEGKDGRIHLQLDGHATFSIGGQMALGANLDLLGSCAIWATARATGTHEFGAQLQYANEPTWLAPWIDRTRVAGAGHRINVLVLMGHGFWMGKHRRAYLGVRLYAGMNHWLSSYTVEYPDESVRGSAKVYRNHFVG